MKYIDLQVEKHKT